MNLRGFKNEMKKVITRGLIIAAMVLTVNSIAGAQTASVTLHWTAPGDDGNNGIASQYDIRYSTSIINEGNWDAATQVSGESAPQAAGSAESHTINNLQSGTTYYFAIKTIDEANNSSGISNIAIRTTGSETIPPSNISSLAASNPTTSSIRLNWTAPGDDGNSGQASQYDIRYATSAINDANWNSATQVSGEPTPQAAGSAETFTVSGLQQSTTYYFAIKTADEIPNWSGLSNVVNATTQTGNIPPGDVENLSIANPTANSVTLAWTAPGADGDQGTVTAYDIRYSTGNINDGTWAQAMQIHNEPIPQSAGSQQSVVINGLAEGTTYYFGLKSVDEFDQWSALSNIPYVTTQGGQDETAPGAVLDVAITATTSSSISLSWTAPGDDGYVGQATVYDIRYNTVAITYANWGSSTAISNEPTPQIAGNQETITITGLQQDVTYYIAIKTYDEVPNYSLLSNIVSSTTPDETAPAAIEDLTAVTGEDVGSISINWTAPGDDDNSGTAASYLIKAYTQPITEANWDTAESIANPPAPEIAGSNQNFVISDLTPGQVYYVAMKSEDDNSNISELSNIASAEAKPFVTDDIDELTGLPKEFDLSQNYPNPFNPTTNIDFSLPEASQVNLDIYDANGRKVVTLTSQHFEAGFHTIAWNGKTAHGEDVSTGVYLYHLTANNYSSVKKMVFLK